MLSFKGELEVVLEDSSRVGNDDLLYVVHISNSSWIHSIG